MNSLIGEVKTVVCAAQRVMCGFTTKQALWTRRGRAGTRLHRLRVRRSLEAQRLPEPMVPAPHAPHREHGLGGPIRGARRPYMPQPSLSARSQPPSTHPRRWASVYILLQCG